MRERLLWGGRKWNQPPWGMWLKRLDLKTRQRRGLSWVGSFRKSSLRVSRELMRFSQDQYRQGKGKGSNWTEGRVRLWNTHRGFSQPHGELWSWDQLPELSWVETTCWAFILLHWSVSGYRLPQEEVWLGEVTHFHQGILHEGRLPPTFQQQGEWHPSFPVWASHQCPLEEIKERKRI